MLYDLIKKGYGKKEKLNCAEKILYGANEVYKLGLDNDSLKLAAGFGGGMAVEETCGALTGAVMVLGRLFVETTGHKDDTSRRLVAELMTRYREEMGHIDCKPLKDNYRSLLSGCDKVILKAAEILDDIVAREK